MDARTVRCLLLRESSLAPQMADALAEVCLVSVHLTGDASRA